MTLHSLTVNGASLPHEVFSLCGDVCMPSGKECKTMFRSLTVLHIGPVLLSFCLSSLLTATTSCPSLEAPAYGSKFGSKYLVGHEVHFTCSQGYHLVGSATRVCQDNGTWTGISAVCKGEFFFPDFTSLFIHG